MVVDDNDAGGVVADGVAKELADADDGGVQIAFVDSDHALHVIFRIQEHHAQFLVFQSAHFQDQQVGNVRRAADLDALLWD